MPPTEFTMETEFTPRQLAEMRQLVREAQGCHMGGMDERGRELHNLGRRLDEYCARANLAVMPRMLRTG